MPMLPAGLAALFVGLLLAVVACLPSRPRERDPLAILDQVGLGGAGLGGGKGDGGPTTLRQAQVRTPFGERVIAPALGRFAGLGRRITPEGQVRRLRRRLDLAGNPPAWDVDRVLGAKALGLITGLTLGLLTPPLAGLAWVLTPSIGLASALTGWFVPDLVLYQYGYERSEKIARTLPDALDLLSISVRAGLSFDAGLDQVARRTTGPLAEEFSRLLQEMRLGAGRAGAFRSLIDRTDRPELTSFLHAMLTSDELGVPIAGVLTAQADELRSRRSQRAEELAQKVPVKILFPLVFCIMPCLFIVVMGPAAIVMIQRFSSGGL